ncbi:MAG: histidine phosphatase family protein [Chloroflexi bacterium]|nr:histidine phosphatase family protein [Chloroflexota bacterium]
MDIFYIVRHAEKQKGDFYNPYLRHQDEPITENGRRSAERLWSFFCKRNISAVYISEYLRTAQTAEFVAGQLGISPVIDRRLNEIDNGVIEGMSDEELQATYPEVWIGYRLRDHDFRFPEGETGAEAQKRIVELLEEKRLVHPSENVLFVCHEGLIRIMTCAIMGLPVYKRWNYKVDFCGIMEISYQPEYNNWKLIRFNNIVDQ